MDRCNDDLFPSKLRIHDPQEVSWARAELWETLSMSPPRGPPSAPTAQPVSLHRHEMEQLSTASENGGVKASLKADGIRYLVLLTQWPAAMVPSGEPRAVALMYDRALVPYEISVWAQPRHFERRTLLDGELVRRTGGDETHDLLWLAFDIIMEAGKRVDHLHYDRRLNRLHTLLDAADPLPVEEQVANGRIAVVNHDTSLKLMVKPYVDMFDIRSLWESRHHAGFNYDGILFTPIAEAARFGKHTSMFKWKSRHTIDVWVARKAKRERGGDTREWIIKVLQRRRVVVASEAKAPILTVNSHPLYLALVSTFALDGIMDDPASSEEGLVLECSMEVRPEQGLVELYPIRHRTDKTHPNSIVTIESTIENVLDHIEVEDLINSIEGSSASR